MSNIKTINWDDIRKDYVMGTDYPNYDKICEKYKISKPLLIAKANDVSDVINRGSTWRQQREAFVKKKQSIQEDIATQEAKNATKTFVKVLHNVGLKSFKLIDNELNWLLEEQKKAKNSGEHFSIGKYVKISDITKVAEVLNKLSGGENSKEILVKLNVINDATQEGTLNLEDLTDEQIKELNEQVRYGGTQQIIDQYDEEDNG